MRKLTISQYRSFRDKGQKLDVRQVSWDEVIETLSGSKQTPETFEEFMAADKDERLRIKDCGYFVGGRFDPPIRLKKNIKGRSLATLDLDHLSFCDVELIKEAFGKYAYLIHSTHSHSDDEPRLRLVLPLSRDVTPLEYEPLCRMIAKRMGLEYFDDSTYQSFRVMFLPSHAVDGDVVFEVNEGQWLDPSKVLDVYEDWGDFAEWPRSSREEKKGIREAVSEAGNPFEKPGYVGAFNRAYPIDEAIETFELPYEESGTGDSRYSYMGGESADGAILYPEQGYLFSHHATDPANGNNCAWDLVRLHKFGALDTEEDRKLPIAKQPSQIAMTEFAKPLEQVLDQAMADPDVVAEDEFEDVVDSDTGETVKVKKEVKLTAEYIMQRIQEAREEEGASRIKAIKRILKNIAAANLAADDEAILIQHVKGVYPDPGPGVAAVRDSVKNLRKGLKGSTADEDGRSIDIDEEFVEHVLAQHFGAGETLRRICKAYWAFSEGRWAMEDEERILRKVDVSVLRLRKERPKDFRALTAAVAERSTPQITSILKPMLARRVSELHDSEDPLGLLKRYPLPVFNMRNCEIHLNRKGQHKVCKHNPANMLDVRLDVHYDKEADAPEWDNFCAMIFRNSEDRPGMTRHLEEVLGYVVQYSRWMKHFGIFMGKTDAGKSTIVDMLKTLLGTAFCEVPISMFGEEKRTPFTNMNLLHKLLLVDEEMSKKGQLPDGALKSLAEEKPISTDIKYAGPLNFVSRVFPLVVSNRWPRSTDVDAAFTNRALIWHFKDSIPEEHKSDEAKTAMLANKAGFLNRLLAGVKRLRARGEFDIPIDCVKAKEEWRIYSDPVLRFATEALEVDKSAKLKDCVSISSVLSHWDLFCGAEGIPLAYRVKPREFWERLGMLGLLRKTSMGARHVSHVAALKDLGVEGNADDDFDDIEEWDT